MENDKLKKRNILVICYLMFFDLEDVFSMIFLTTFWPGFKWLSFLPEIIFLATILYGVNITLYETHKNNYMFFYQTIILLLGFIVLFKICVGTILMSGTIFLFNFCFITNTFTVFSQLLILSVSLVYLQLNKETIKITTKIIIVELPWLLLFAIFFLSILVTTFDLFGAYIIIEGLSLTLFILACINGQNNLFNKEAAFKYLALNSISSGFFLAGICWVYMLTNKLNYQTINFHIITIHYQKLVEIPFKCAILSLIVAFCFKVGAFPSYLWIADIYNGIWTPISFFFATVVKLTYALFIIKFFYSTIFYAGGFWTQIFSILGIISILLGAFGAIYQNEIKRFLAFASINHMGILLVGLATHSWFGLKASCLHLIIYIFSNIIFFGIIVNSINLINGRNINYFSDFSGLSSYNPSLAIIIAITLFSMAGIPPLAGFFTKFYVFCSLTRVNFFNNIDGYLNTYTIFFILLLSLLSTFYYINIIKQVFFEIPKKNHFFWTNTNTQKLVSIMMIPISTWLIFFEKVSSWMDNVLISCSTILTSSKWYLL